MRLRAGAAAVAGVLLLVGCTKVVGIPGPQIPRLGQLAHSAEVDVRDEDGDPVTITRRTRLTLFVPGLPPIETQPDELGFSMTALRLGDALDPRAPTLEYRNIARADARVSDTLKTMLAIFIPVGALVTLYAICLADGGCDGPGT